MCEVPHTLAWGNRATIPPIIFAMADDPVRLRFVGSLSRPEGNIAGVILLVSEIVPKRLE
jgi:ABC-type uncharacterized transport system substrate-binding protein